MAAVRRLQRLTSNSIQNLIHRHLLRPTATSFGIQNLMSILHDKKYSSSSVTEFPFNWNISCGVFPLHSFDLSLMEARGRSASDVEEDDDDDDYADEEEEPLDFDDVDDEYGSESDSGDDDGYGGGADISYL